jgi:hypothetical protein
MGSCHENDFLGSSGKIMADRGEEERKMRG